MPLIRTILAALIAISVAVLPATGEAIALPAAGQAVMADQADMPCCPCCNTRDDLQLTACALKCIGAVGVVFLVEAAAPPYSVRDVLLPFADDPLHEFLKAPPTHPPRH